MKSNVTDIEFLSKTRQTFENELSFAGKGLKLNTRQDIKEICEAILNFKNLKVLRLEGNTISPEAADELSKALVKHPELERLIANDLFTGRLKDEIPLALKSICGAIETSGSRLVEINMSDNAFGPIGLDALVSFFQSDSCFSLKEIRMHNNGLGPQGSQKFASALEKCYQRSNEKFNLKVFVCGRNRLELEGSKSISNVLKQIGTLEEIQMPQNGIRSNGIEFLADACANNPNLRIINFNDNTFLKTGAEQMSRALINLKKLEYLNLGDCLLRSRGSVLITRAVIDLPLIKEINLSFNEINLQSGIEISELLAKKVNKTLSLLDLNGNKFGEDGKLEIKEILQPISASLASLSEDEGSDEEEEEEGEEEDEEEESEEEEEEEEEEENSEVVVDDEYDDYDQVENEEAEEYEEKEIEKKFGDINLVQQSQQPSLFSNFKTQPAQTQPGPNLFSNMVKNSFLITSIQLFDNFILNPNILNLKQINQDCLNSVSKTTKFNSKFLIKFFEHLSKFYDKNSADLSTVLNTANILTKNYFEAPISKQESFVDQILTELGFLKSEEKGFKPVELTENLFGLLEVVSKQSFFPQQVKQQLVNFLNLRNSLLNQDKNKQAFKKNLSDLLIKCFS